MNEENLYFKTIEEKPKLLGIITSPTEQFFKIKQKPLIWFPLIIISLLMMIAAVVSALNIDYINDPTIQESIEILGIDEGLMIKFSAILAGLGSLFVPGIKALISTIIYFIIARIIKKSVSFKQLFSMNTYILLISALSVILNTILSFVLTGKSTVLFTSLAAIIQTDNLIIESLFSMIEAFTIWGLILTTIGLQRVANFSKRVSVIIVIGFYLLSLLFSLFSGWIMTLNI